MRSFLIFFAAGLWCLPLRGDTLTNAIEFQNSIPRPGSIQWDINHRLYKERQELYRKRMAIPNAVRTDVPVAAGAYLAFNRKTVAAPTPPPAGSFEMFLKLTLYAVVFILIGGLILHDSPHMFSRT